MPRKPRFGSIYRRKKKRDHGAFVELPTWWIQFRHQGKRVRESSESTRYADAERLLRQRMEEVSTGKYAGPQAERITVAELLDDLITDFEDNGKSVEWLRYVDGHLRPFFGAMKASAVQTRRIKDYISERRTAGMKNSTINRELAVLHRAFSLAYRETPPRVKHIPAVPRLEEPPARKGFFDHDDFTALRSELPDHLRPLITFAYFTGCRKGEILALQWDQIDFRARVVRLEPGETKNDEARTIPLIGELYEMLVIQRQIRDQRWPDCPWVFSRYGKRIRDIRGAWEEASRRAGVWKAETKRSKYIFHDLRRTGARNLVRAGVPERVVMSIGGWKTRAVFDRYNIVSERDLHDAAAKLERHIAELETRSDGHTLGTPQAELENHERRTVPKLLN
jgi:integrase